MDDRQRQRGGIPAFSPDRPANSSRMAKDIRRLTRLRAPEDQERCIGARLDSAVGVVDVDSRFASRDAHTDAGKTSETPAELVN